MMISALNRLPDGTVELTITIPWDRVNQSYQKNLNNLAKNTQIKGFRKGKASLSAVEKKLGKSTVYQEVLKNLIPEVWIETLKEHNLKPIINPQVNLIFIEENKDWQIKAITCEAPKVELGNYKEAVKRSLASEKIWVPGKDKKEVDQEKGSKKLDKIFKSLLETAKVVIPEILTQDEVNRLLSRLLDQTSKLGLTVEQYLASVGKTADQLRGEYYQQAEKSLKLELILSAIAEKEKIQVRGEEVERMIQAIPEEESRQAFQTPEQKAYIRQLLRKRKVIDNLSKL